MQKKLVFILINISIIVSLFFISAQCQLKIKKPQPKCCVVIDLYSNETLGCVNGLLLHGSEEECYNKFYKEGNTFWISKSCEELETCKNPVYSCFGYSEEYNAIYKLKRDEFACTPDNKIYQCVGNQVSLYKSCEDLICDPLVKDCMYNTALVLYFHFDKLKEWGENDTFVKDFSGHQNHGKVINASWIEKGKVNGAYLFDEKSTIEVENSTSLDLKNFLTVEAWIYPNKIENNTIQKVVAKEAYSLELFEDKIRFWITDGYKFAEILSRTPIKEKNWTHIGVVFNGSILKIFINGKLNAKSDSQVKFLKEDHQNLKIGDHFEGMIDEVKIYNYPLSENNIFWDYCFYNEACFVCKDTDGGIEESVKGKVYYFGKEKCPTGCSAEDYCIDLKTTINGLPKFVKECKGINCGLREYFCDPVYMFGVKDIKTPYGCKDGRSVAGLSVSTKELVYDAGENISLTDPPFSGDIVFSLDHKEWVDDYRYTKNISTLIQQREREFTGFTLQNQNLVFSNQTAFEGYIIQLEGKPLLKKKIELEKQNLPESQKVEILKEYRTLLLKQHAKVKDEIFYQLNPKPPRKTYLLIILSIVLLAVILITSIIYVISKKKGKEITPISYYGLLSIIMVLLVTASASLKITGSVTTEKENKLEVMGEYYLLFNGMALNITPSQVEKIERLSSVKKVYPNYKVQAYLKDSVPMINASLVWNMIDKNGKNITGENITIAILDTGIDYTHPDLGNCTREQFLLGRCEKVIGGVNVVYTVDMNNDGDLDDCFVEDENGTWCEEQFKVDKNRNEEMDCYREDPNGTICELEKDIMDDNGHGTHCASIAAGNGKVKGVAPQAKLLGYKVLSSRGIGSDSWILRGIEMAIDPNGDGDTSDGADIISMSLGGVGSPDNPVSQAVNTAVKNGITVVVAAGNFGGWETIGHPGNAKEAITVGAIDKNYTLAFFSSKGPVIYDSNLLIKPEIAAPGVDICAAKAASSIGSSCIDDWHVSHSGTSMATPHVAGVVALIKQAHPEWDPKTIESVLIETSTPINNTVYEIGGGLVDVYRAIDTKIVIDPNPLSFGVLNFSVINTSSNFSIKNLGKDNYGIELVFENFSEIYTGKKFESNISASLDKFCLKPFENKSVSLFIDIRNLDPGTYSGKVYFKIYPHCNFTKSPEKLVMPIGFAKSKIVKISIKWPMVFDNDEERYLFVGWMLNSTPEGYPQVLGTFFVEGKYPELSNFSKIIYIFREEPVEFFFSFTTGSRIEDTYCPYYCGKNPQKWKKTFVAQGVNLKEKAFFEIFIDESKVPLLYKNVISLLTSKNMFPYEISLETWRNRFGLTGGFWVRDHRPYPKASREWTVATNMTSALDKYWLSLIVRGKELGKWYNESKNFTLLLYETPLNKTFLTWYPKESNLKKLVVTVEPPFKDNNFGIVEPHTLCGLFEPCPNLESYKFNESWTKVIWITPNVLEKNFGIQNWVGNGIVKEGKFKGLIGGENLTIFDTTQILKNDTQKYVFLNPPIYLDVVKYNILTTIRRAELYVGLFNPQEKYLPIGRMGNAISWYQKVLDIKITYPNKTKNSFKNKIPFFFICSDRWQCEEGVYTLEALLDKSLLNQDYQPCVIVNFSYNKTKGFRIIEKLIGFYENGSCRGPPYFLKSVLFNPYPFELSGKFSLRMEKWDEIWGLNKEGIKCGKTYILCRLFFVFDSYTNLTCKNVTNCAPDESINVTIPPKTYLPIDKIWADLWKAVNASIEIPLRYRILVEFNGSVNMNITLKKGEEKLGIYVVDINKDECVINYGEELKTLEIGQKVLIELQNRTLTLIEIGKDSNECSFIIKEPVHLETFYKFMMS